MNWVVMQGRTEIARFVSPIHAHLFRKAALETGLRIIDVTDSEGMQGQVQEFMNYSKQHTRMDRWPGFNFDSKQTKDRRKWCREEHNELQDALDDGDAVETIDAMCDLIYILFGMAAEFGITLQPFFDEVHRSNMTKEPNDTLDKARQGKVKKGPNYEPPEIAKVFEKQYGSEVTKHALGVESTPDFSSSILLGGSETIK